MLEHDTAQLLHRSLVRIDARLKVPVFAASVLIEHHTVPVYRNAEPVTAGDLQHRKLFNDEGLLGGDDDTKPLVLGDDDFVLPKANKAC